MFPSLPFLSQNQWPCVWRPWLGFALFVLYSAGSADAAEAVDFTFFEQKVRPVLIEHCYFCHSADAKKLKGNLYLDSKAGWQKGGDSGRPAIIPGDPEGSYLIQTIRHEEVDMEMPPKKPKLPDALIADLMTWIQMGAPDPRDGKPVEVNRADKSWWSLQPLAKSFEHHSIDGFIETRFKAEGLTFSSEADPRTLIRRLSYTLTGLPPTAEEVDAFAEEHPKNPQAYENLVDRMLASPRYGEQWGRRWLDVVRFGESNGFERNFVIDDLWPFRDFVIRSFNEDKAFDQFIVEHLAGDVVGKGNPEVEVGSAFIVAGPYDDVKNQDPVAEANIRAATLDDMVTATSGAFLGLTINCARCHNHKFDPIPTEDFYRIQTVFEGVKHGRRVVASDAEKEAHRSAVQPLQAKKKPLTDELTQTQAELTKRAKDHLASKNFSKGKGRPELTQETFDAVSAKYVRLSFQSTTADPKSGSKGKLSSVEVWTAEETPRNVALSSLGAKAEGARSITAEDFPEAYGPQYTIDGRNGEQWVIGNPPQLTIVLPQEFHIDRVTYRNGRADSGEGQRGATPADYVIEVSTDGKQWTWVADSREREPWSPAHGIERYRRELIQEDEAARIQELNKQIAEIDAKLAKVPPLREVWVGTYSQPKEPTRVNRGGDPMKPGEVVLPSSLSVLDQIAPGYALAANAPEGDRRLALAKWIVGNENPLTVRVLANRIWQGHFGTGIVDTPSDFGFLGSKPTHPELLDYLAVRLKQHGWRLKALHREIVLSRTYRQSSTLLANKDAESATHFAKGLRADKASRLLWRYPGRRLGAEEIRDTLLAVAGELKLEPMGGPGFRLYRFTQNNVCTYIPLDQHGPETYRRAVYHQNARASVVDILNDFDLPDIAFAAPKRSQTTTPLQALTMMNHGFILKMAESMAERGEGRDRESGAKDLGVKISAHDPITAVYRLAFQRPPTVGEHQAASKLVEGHGLVALCRALLNANELIYLE